MSTHLRKLPGLLLCLLLALPAWCLGRLFPIIGAPVFAILLGMLLALFYHHCDKTKEGISFTSKYILQTAVVLLGFGLNLTQVMAVGMQSLPIIVSTIATAPVIKAKDDDVAKAISVIFLFNMLAALLFPSLGQLLGLSNEGFAIFAGTAVNDTSSVTATATAWDAIHHSNTLDGATIVKLTRTLAILPIALGLSLYQAKKEHDIVTEENFSLRKSFPRFILFFLLASLITTLMTSLGVSADVFHSLKTLSKFFIVMAMAAIGLHTNLVKLIKTGGQAIFLGAICWVAITLVSLAMQLSLGIW
ncbi:TPA: YeiH family putative sulfate export transporter [Streptococcus pyogenes NGAS438]|nr:YeiH family putative sulfate export transporter [Streptococcus pyogenes NGAS438]